MFVLQASEQVGGYITESVVAWEDTSPHPNDLLSGTLNLANKLAMMHASVLPDVQSPLYSRTGTTIWPTPL